jgi:hypothetical protein
MGNFVGMVSVDDFTDAHFSTVYPLTPHKPEQAI